MVSLPNIRAAFAAAFAACGAAAANFVKIRKFFVFYRVESSRVESLVKKEKPQPISRLRLFDMAEPVIPDYLSYRWLNSYSM
tara:strand:+ start:3494 stop:3739 length:246 start_codon:yes stop_codon:yes gene_type:complete